MKIWGQGLGTFQLTPIYHSLLCLTEEITHYMLCLAPSSFSVYDPGIRGPIPSQKAYFPLRMCLKDIESKHALLKKYYKAAFSIKAKGGELGRSKLLPTSG